MQRSKLPYLFLGLAAVLAVSAVVSLIFRSSMKPDRIPPAAPPPASIPSPIPEIAPPDETAPPNNPITKPKRPEPNTSFEQAADLVNQFSNAFNAGDLASLNRLIGKTALEPKTAERLKDLCAARVQISPNGTREIGELELGNRIRWVLELADQKPECNHIFLDLRRDNQKWSVEKITLPPATNEPIPAMGLTDSLGVADAFLQAVLRQDFELAHTFVDPSLISNTKIAGLCILFENGGYRLRSSKSLRAMFQRQDTVGYLVNVETQDAKQNAQFTLTLKQAPSSGTWRVAAINLDAFLSHYAARVASGDVDDSPLVKNPAGGDTLALYFEFDEDSMNARTRRQLEIISRILRSDPSKKLTLSGHTDSLGTKNYNDDLSSRRAIVVKEFLVQAGVASSQITTVAKGSSQPRRPNITESGKDSPEGRRANRRTEIYLDF